MKISELLRDRESTIYRIKASDNIASAAVALTDHGVGALLVEDAQGQIVGILSERDIVRGMVPHGADLHDVEVSELMTQNLISCAPSDTVHTAMAMMTDRRIRHLPVFDGDELVGFVSIGDLVKCRIMEVQAEAEAMREYITS